MNSEKKTRPSYHDEYYFRLRAISSELLVYLKDLKLTLGYSPWFQSLILRSMIEPDDRRRAARELGLNLDEFSNTQFLLAVAFKGDYRVTVTNHQTQVVNVKLAPDATDPAGKLIMFPKEIPSTLPEQWRKLSQLVAFSNQL